MASRGKPSVVQMARSRPVRTGLFSLGPPAVGGAQLLNTVFHGGSVPLVSSMATLMVLFSVLVTRYHLAVFHRRSLSTRSD